MEQPRTVNPRKRARRSRLFALPWVLPALAVYSAFVLFPLVQSLRYSLYDWDGVGVATPVGLQNYVDIFRQRVLLDSIIHALILIVFFSLIPVILGLVAAEVMRGMKGGAFNQVGRVFLFLPQVVPLAGAAIAWTWMYSDNGLINQILSAIGLSRYTRDWLGDFTMALPAVGIIGAWVALGLCTLLLLAGIGKIDRNLYEAAQIDGAGRVRQFLSVTLPGLRREISFCLTITIISALSSFDIVYVSTRGGPGYSTMVPGVKVFQLIFSNQEVGLASALGVALAAMVFLIVLPIQRIGGGR